jgi:hypothetical protein
LTGALIAAPLLSAMAQGTALDSAMTRCLSADTATAWQKLGAAWAAEAPGSWSNDSLRRELLALGEADQAQRILLTGDSLRNPAFIQRMAAGDSVRASQLRAIVARHGWPGKSMVGARAATAAFLIVQHHADLQQEMLALLRAQPPGEVNPADLAMLEDRVRMNAGLPQRYGTQFKPPGETTIELYPIEEPGGLETRRAAAGLPPMKVYVCFIEAQYQRKVQIPPHH